MASVASVAVAVEILSESHKRWNMLYQNENNADIVFNNSAHFIFWGFYYFVNLLIKNNVQITNKIYNLFFDHFLFFLILFPYFIFLFRPENFHPKIFLTGFVSFTLTEKLSCENTHIYAKYLHPNIQNN